MTSTNGNIFRVTGRLCGEFTGPGEFPAQRPVTRSFDVFCDLRQNKRLRKQSWGWWFETLSRPLWRHWNGPIELADHRLSIAFIGQNHKRSARTSACGHWSTMSSIDRPNMAFDALVQWHFVDVMIAMVGTHTQPSEITNSHYNDVIMGAIASQITSLTIVFSTDYSDADQIKHQSSASLAFVRGIHRGSVNFPHKWPVTQKMFPFDDVIMHG